MRPALLALLLPAAAVAADPVCAVLDPGRSDRAALLETKLAAEPGLTLVDRTDLDRVLKELRLQAAFGPQGVADRVRLGRVLKADVLVLVRPAPAPGDPALELVVCESAGGLRVLADAVPVTRDADADADALLRATRAGLAKCRRPVAEVVAVPPFVSQDLSADADHLKAVLARLAEGAALSRPGAVAVELAEADAVAREAKLAGENGPVRPLPVFLLGEYRHAGRGAARTLTVTLRAERAGRSVGRSQTWTGRPADAAAGVTKLAADLLAAVGGGNPAAPDPAAEADQLAARGRYFARFGQGSDALPLFEAAALLAPDRPDLHLEAGKLLAAEHARIAPFANAPPAADALRKLVPLHRRGREHAAALLARAADLDLPRLAAGLGGWAASRAVAPATLAAAPPDLAGELRDLRDEDRDRIVPLLPRLAKERPEAVPLAVAPLLRQYPPAERFALLDRLIRELKGVPGTAERLAYLATAGGRVVPADDTPELRAFVSRLAADPDPEVKAAAAFLRDRLPKPAAPPPATTDTPTPPPAAGPVDAARLRPLNLPLPAGGGPLVGLAAAGPGVDVLWSRSAVYLLGDDGKLREAASVRERLRSVHAVHPDGRLVWVTGAGPDHVPVLLTLDPTTGRVTPVTAADGLPTPVRGGVLLVAPLAAGRAVVAGSHGPGWVGTVTFDAGRGRADVTILHEARETPPTLPAGRPAGLELAFAPDAVAVVRDPAGKPAKLVVGRAGVRPGAGVSADAVRRFPLLLDPDRPGAEVASAAFGLAGATAGPDGAVYQLAGADPDWTLVRTGLPSAKPVAEEQPLGGGLVRSAVPLPLPARPLLPAGVPQLLAHAGRLHVVIPRTGVGEVELAVRGGLRKFGLPAGTRLTEWRTANLDGSDVRLLADRLPPVTRAAVGGRIGLAVVGPDGVSAVSVTAVLPAAPAPSADAARLTDLARRHADAGEWADALAAAEGAVKLASDRPDPYRLAATAAAGLNDQTARDHPADADAARGAVARYARGLELCEGLLAAGGRAPPVRRLDESVAWLLAPPTPLPPDLRAVADAGRAAVRERRQRLTKAAELMP